MKRLITSEFRKLLMDKVSLFLMLVLIGVNGMLLSYEVTKIGEEQYSKQELASIYTDIYGLLPKEQLIRLEEDVGILYTQIYDLTKQEEMDRWLGQIQAYTKVKEHIEKSIAYPEYLKSVSEQTKSLSQSTLLSGKNTFASKNSKMLAEFYEKLPAWEELSVVSSIGMELLVGYPLTDVLFVIGFVILVLRLTTAEREEGYYDWIHVTKRGRTESFVAKGMVLLFSLFLLMLLFYGSAYLILDHMVGFNGWMHPVQSMETYYHCHYEWTIAEFFCFCFFIKAAAFMVIFFLIYMVGAVCKNFVTAFSLTGAIFILEYLCWQMIDRHSSYGILKECNLFAYLDTEHYVKTALNSNLFGNPISVQMVGVVSAITIAVVATVLAWVFWRTSSAIMLPALRKKKKSGKYSVSLWKIEYRKLFVINRAGMYSVLFVLLMFVIGDATSSSYISQTEYFYRLYSENLIGKLSKEKEQYLAQEEAYIASYSERIDEYYRRYEEGEISEELLNYYIESSKISNERKVAFEKVQTQYQELMEKEAEGITVLYLNESGWERLTNEKGMQKMYQFQLLLTIFLIFCLHDFVCMEDIVGMRKILNTTSNGKNRLIFIKAMIAIVFAGSMSLFLYFLQFVMVHKDWILYEWNSLSTSIMSITAFTDVTVSCPVFIYLILVGIGRMLIGIIEAVVILSVSGIVKKKLPTILGSFLLLGLPLIIKMWEWQ